MRDTCDTTGDCPSCREEKPQRIAHSARLGGVLRLGAGLPYVRSRGKEAASDLARKEWGRSGGVLVLPHRAGPFPNGLCGIGEGWPRHREEGRVGKKRTGSSRKR